MWIPSSPRVYLLRCASNFRHCISALYRELSSPLSDSLYARPERARSWYYCRILRAAASPLLGLVSYPYSSFRISPRSCPRLFAFRRRLLRLLFEKQSEPDFWKDFLLLHNNMIINGRNFGNKAKLYISSSALFLALTCIININFHHQLCNYSIKGKPYRIKRSLYISSNIIHDIDLHSDTRYWTLN